MTLRLVPDLLQKSNRIHAHRVADGENLRYVDLALIAFDHSDDRMWPLQTCGQLTLRQTYL